MPPRPRRFRRRDVVKGAFASGLSAALSGCVDRRGTRLGDDAARAIVVGSGFGGAVAAYRLTAAGIPVTLIERGKRWELVSRAEAPFASTLVPDKRSTWLRERTVAPFGPSFSIEPYVGVLDRIDQDGIQIYAGAGFGGGSLVYGGISVQPGKALFERVFPAAIAYEEMDAVYYPRARERLRVSPMPEAILAADPYRAVRVFRDHAAKAGLSTSLIPTATDWDVIARELAGETFASATKGELLYGNNSGSKVSLDRTYLREAEATGLLTVLTLHLVREIAVASDGSFVLAVDAIDEGGEVLEQRTLACESLFLCAGSHATTSLLVRARETGALDRLDPAVGHGWGNNGNVMFMREGLADDTGAIQGGPPASVLADPDNPEAPIHVDHAQFPSGFECQCLLHLGIAVVDSRGEFVFDKASDAVRLRFPEGGNEASRRAATAVVDRLNEANGGELAHNGFLDGLLDGFTYHPVGGVVIGEACDLVGRVRGYDNLYVLDGASMPGSGAGANPSLTITALAERAMDHILAEDFAG